MPEPPTPDAPAGRRRPTWLRVLAILGGLVGLWLLLMALIRAPLPAPTSVKAALGLGPQPALPRPAEIERIVYDPGKNIDLPPGSPRPVYELLPADHAAVMALFADRAPSQDIGWAYGIGSLRIELVDGEKIDVTIWANRGTPAEYQVRRRGKDYSLHGASDDEIRRTLDARARRGKKILED